MKETKTINEARRIFLNYVLPTALLCYPKLNDCTFSEIVNLKVAGVLKLGTKKVDLSLEEKIRFKMSEENDYDFDKKKNIVVKVPSDKLGSGTFVIFELPQ